MLDDLGNNTIFSGNIYVFSAFDVGDDINLERVCQISQVTPVPLTLPKYFKNYHTPLAIDMVPLRQSPHFTSCKVHNFGAISLLYKIPFNDTLVQVRKKLSTLCTDHVEQSATDVKYVFSAIDQNILNPKFFDVRSSYAVVQLDPHPDYSVSQLQEQYGSIIASMLRFETEALAEEQRNEILDSAIGYFRGDLIIVEADVAFAYDNAFHEMQDFFEFANIQQLELRYFDRFLDAQLNKIYEGGTPRLPLRSYLPFISTIAHDPVTDLGKIKVDISVITERLESSIKLAGEPYFSELYELIVEKLDLKNWRAAIDRKLGIIHDVRAVYQHKTDTVREDLLSVLIILLIFIELVIGLLHYLK